MISIKDNIKTVVNNLKVVNPGPPYFMSGHRNEIAARLLRKTSSPSGKGKKYPLIILATDIKADKKDLLEYSLNLAIVIKTKESYTDADRETISFAPILRPLYESFIQGIVDSGLFVIPGGDPTDPPHSYVERGPWGVWSSEGTLKQYLPEPLDAIEITNLRLNVLTC